MLASSASAIDIISPAAHCESDTIEIERLLKQLSEVSKEGDGHKAMSRGERRAYCASLLEGREIDRSALTDSAAKVSLNIHTFTPLSFINTVEALCDAADSQYPSWRQFAAEYQRLACRRGEEQGFTSLLWLGSEWIADNVYRGNIAELTDDDNGSVSKTRSLDLMSRHRERYAPLRNDSVYDRVNMIEMGFRTHKIPYMKRQSISASDVEREMKPGDVLMLLTNRDGEDIYRIGYVVERDGRRYLMMVDSAMTPQEGGGTGKVTLSPEPLDRYFKLVAKYFFGYRWLRWK